MDKRFNQALAEGERLGARYALARSERAPVGRMGAELGQRAGSSLEFMDHRDYHPGDDLRRIDWSAYARSDRLTVKLYREEVSPHLDLALDGSKSMDLPDTEKARAAAALSGALTTAAANAGFSHRVHLASAGFEPLPGSEHRPAAWTGLRFDSERTCAEAYAAMPPNWRPRTVRLLLSDLLWPGDPLPLMRRFAAGAAACHVVQLLAEADRTPPRRGNLRLVDSENGEAQELYLDAAAERRYQQALAQQSRQWQAACREVGATLTTLIAERVTAGDLHPLIEGRLLTFA